MPHQCTGCGHTFEDGSKEMLGGCPSCGGNKFQFYPPGTDVPDEPPAEADPPDPPDPEGSSVANAVGRASTAVRDLVSGGADEPGRVSPPADPSAEADTPTEADAPTGTDTPTETDVPAEADPPEPDAAWPSEEGSEADGQPPGPAEDPHSSTGDDDIIDADARAAAGEAGPEDGAQADARGEFVTEDELALHDDAPSEEGGASDGPPGSGASSTAGSSAAGGAGSRGEPGDDPSTGELPEAAHDGRVVSEPSEDQPDIAELREQLNDQFESIKIVEPGQYELNLMELYDREEYIIALQENGRYVIQVPEDWLGDRVEE